MTVDNTGRVHVLMRGENGKPAYFSRDPQSGNWKRSSADMLGSLIAGQGNDLHVVSSDGLWRTSANHFGKLEPLTTGHGEYFLDSKMGIDQTRIGHHNALSWNLCEEYNVQFDFGPERIRSFADYILATDPYDHPISVHSAHDPLAALRFTFGDSRFSLTSIQLNQRRIDTLVDDFREATKDAGRPLPVSMDESVAIARTFMEDHLPFWEMSPADALVDGESTIDAGLGAEKSFQLDAQVFQKPNAVYAIYFPTATQTGRLDLTEADGAFQARWFNPRSGQFEGSDRMHQAGDWVNLGSPPSHSEQDWVLLLKRRF